MFINTQKVTNMKTKDKLSWPITIDRLLKKVIKINQLPKEERGRSPSKIDSLKDDYHHHGIPPSSINIYFCLVIV